MKAPLCLAQPLPTLLILIVRKAFLGIISAHRTGEYRWRDFSSKHILCLSRRSILPGHSGADIIVTFGWMFFIESMQTAYLSGDR